MSTINLLPQGYTKRRVQHRASLVCIGLFGIVMLSVIGGVMASKHRIANTQIVLDRINTDYLEATKKFEEMQQLQKRKIELISKAENTGALLERIPRSTLLAIITNARTNGVCLKRFYLSTKRVMVAVTNKKTKAKSAKFAAKKKKKGKPAKKAQQNVSLELAGWARTDIEVGEFIFNLNECPLINSVELVFSKQEEIDDVLVRSFKLNIDLNSSGDAIDVARAAMGTTEDQPQEESSMTTMFQKLLGVGS